MLAFVAAMSSGRLPRSSNLSLLRASFRSLSAVAAFSWVSSRSLRERRFWPQGFVPDQAIASVGQTLLRPGNRGLGHIDLLLGRTCLEHSEFGLVLRDFRLRLLQFG